MKLRRIRHCIRLYLSNGGRHTLYQLGVCLVGEYSKVKFSILRRCLRHENVLNGEPGASFEDFCATKWQFFSNFRDLDASVLPPLATGSKWVCQAFLRRRTLPSYVSCQSCSFPDSPRRPPSSLPCFRRFTATQKPCRG